ncbi:Sap, sulfolipid-1-addressing protein [Arthrobacter alpinus]|uniref:Sap, sulfolipid-1-addressing protein n=2 Tax=Arthrobacter alpinus TaxID=656366 RepID=A0A1H5KTD2_9MICC|nr:Sap, sulfolipid-1-addressing protein [Arthrobacter alpinus]
MGQMADARCKTGWHAGNMTIAIYAQLAFLALIDSTSIGTLLIPLWLLLRHDARRIALRILLYLGVLAGFYLVVGIVVLSGAGWVVKGLGADSLMQVPAIAWAATIGGGAMLSYAVFSDSRKKRKKASAPSGGPAGIGAEENPDHRTETPVSEQRWQARIAKALRSPGGLVTLALIAGMLELPTMLPYLVAIGLLSNSTLAIPAEIGVLAVYCLVMLIPALALWSLRMIMGSRLDSALRRVGTKLGRFASESLLWVVGIVGFVMLRAGLSELAPMASWNPFK